MVRLFLAVAVVGVSTLNAASAQAIKIKVKSRGELRSETRHFFIEDEEPLTVDTNSALAARLELKGKVGDLRVMARGFARYDPTDVARSAAFAEDVFAEYRLGDFRLRVGAMLLNWTATEAFHPADIINSRYLDSNLENAEKRGEPMVALRYKFLDGNVELYYMPFFVEPIFPSPFSRLSFAPPGVAVENVLAVQRGGGIVDDWELTYQMGGRILQTIGDADVSFHVISHIDRSTPSVIFLEDGSPAAVYQPVIQYGGTYTHLVGPLIAKVEAAYRQYYAPPGGRIEAGLLPERPDFGQIAVGFEYGIPQSNGGELTVIVEGQTVLAVEGEGAFGLPDGNTGLQLPLFQRDALLGLRYVANDIVGTEFLLTAIVDLERSEQFLVNARYSRRLGESFGLATGLRLLQLPPEDGGPPVGFAALNGEHQVYLEVSKYF